MTDAAPDTSDNETPETTSAGVMRPRGMSGTKVIVTSKFEIDLTRPLAEFDHDYAEVYECIGADNHQRHNIAYVIKDRYPVRQDVLSVCYGSQLNGLLSLRAANVVEWPVDDSQRFVLVFARPPGQIIFPKNLQRREPISEDIMRRNIIRPTFYALRDLIDRGVFHGSVRPSNIFYTGGENTEAVLGECVSAMPGINQPVLIETVERGMADPDARGLGSPQDDIYSFGATVAILMRGANPMEGKNDRQIVEEKISRSSYAVLTDGLRLSPGLSEFLRATLNDDPKQRWTLEQVSAWVDGSRTTPKQTTLLPKAQRALDFNGKKYIRPRMLARDLLDNVAEAVTLIESGHVTKWVERAMGDQERADMITEAISRAGIGGRTTGYEDRLICYISMALDPRAPVRFKGLRFMPSGFNYSLINAVIQGKPLQAHGEVLRDRLAWMWLGYKENITPETNELLRQFDLASKNIVRRGLDFGIERCLYDLNSDVPCLSDMIKKRYAANCGHLIEAIDHVSDQYKDSRPIDRHIASFISVRDSRDNAGLIALVDSDDKIKRSLSLLTMWQSIQKRNDNPKLSGLCEWLKRDAETIAQRFHSQGLKEDLLKNLPKEVKSGNLTKMMMLVDNPHQVKRDEAEFNRALNMYMACGNERDRIRKQLENDPHFGESAGRHIAMVISGILAGVIIAAVIMLHFAQGSGYGG